MASQIFFFVDGIPGDSKAAKFGKWHEILSFSWSISKAGPSKPSFSSFSMMLVSPSTASRFMLNAAIGKIFKQAIVVVASMGEGGAMELERFTFTNISFDSFNENMSDGENFPMLSVSFVYTRVAHRVTRYSSDGTISSQLANYYDLETGIGG